MSRSRPLNVYVIGSAQGPQKIGVSDNLTSRVINLQAGKQARLAVVFSQERPRGDARLIERAAHDLLAAKRAEGEWFNVTIDEAIEAVSLAIGKVDSGEIELLPPRAPQSNVIGVRFERDERKALEVAAAAEDRALAAFIRRCVVDVLRKTGYLKEKETND